METIEKRAREILSGLTLEEKIGQLTQRSFSEENVEKLIEDAREGRVSSVILGSTAFAGSDEEKLTKKNPIDRIQEAALNSRAGIPIVFGKDVIHGYMVMLPVPLAMSSSFDFDLIERAFGAVRDEAMSFGVNWTFAPMLDMAHDPRWGRMVEGPGEDPYVGARVARAIVRGFQGDDKNSLKMAACAKHFVGYGAAEGGRDYHKTEISDYTLRNQYFPAFRAAIDEGVATVMNSFNEIGGLPVAANRHLLTDMLRGELGFDGFVISDWDAISELIHHGVAGDKREAACLAINAGVDMDMVDGCYEENLRELILSGSVSMETLDEAVMRVLRVKLRLGLFEKPYRGDRSCGEFDLDGHMEIAKEMARESMVLLKNEGGLLPLDINKEYALTGPFADVRKCLIGTWSADGEVELITSIAGALTNKSDKVKFFRDSFNVGGEARYLAGFDTVILALGEDSSVSGEARSVSDLELSPEQVALIRRLKRMGKKLVGVIVAARPLALENVERELDAIIYAWHGGTETGNALAELIFGEYSPSGRMAATMPRVTGQVPIYYNYPPSGRDCAGYYKTETDIFHNYEDCLDSPLYPFGYGLTYTEFTYSDIEIGKTEFTLDELRQGIKASVSVSNSGDFAASEVVQCYIRDVKSSMTRPIKELKATEKVFLEKGETKKIVFTLTERELGFYNREGKFAVEKGEFLIYIGKDALDERKISIKLI